MRGWTGLAIAGALALGCAGMMGYGPEVASTPVAMGAPFSVALTTAAPGKHSVWLDYDLEHPGLWQVTGPFEAVSGATSLGSWDLTFEKDGNVTSAGGPRLTLNTMETQTGLTGQSRGTIWLVDLPEQPVGTPIEVRGTFAPAAGTTVRSMRLVVTGPQ